MKILVTGGGGFVGLALVRRLSELGHDVSSFSRNIHPEHQQLGISIIKGDVTIPADIEKACSGMDAVFHIAAKVSIWGSYADFYAVNVVGTQNVINACKKNQVKRLIFTSSASVVFDGSDIEGANESLPYPEHRNSPYAATKAEAERLVLQANSEALKTISLRPHIIWGPGDTQIIPKTIERARKGRLRKPGRRDCYIDTLHVSNLVNAQVLALNKMDENPSVCGRTFFITNGHPILIWDFLNGIIQSAGLPPVVKSVPVWAAWIYAWALEKMHQLFRLKSEPYLTRFLVLQLCRHHWFDISAAKTMLDFMPIDLRPGKV